jgi:phosphate transport system permease protein
MTLWPLTFFAVVLLSSYFGSRSKAALIAGASTVKIKSQPAYHGYFAAICCGLPALLVLSAWITIEPIVLRSLVLDGVNVPAGESLDVLYLQIKNIASGSFAHTSVSAAGISPELKLAAHNYTKYSAWSHKALLALFFAAALIGALFARSKVAASFRAREHVETAFRYSLMLCASVAILTTVGIVCSLIFESSRFFTMVPFTEFLFGTKWSPQMAIREDQVASSGAFGAIPLFSGTLLIAFIAMCVAAPVGIFSAVYLSEYAHPKVRAISKPMLEILAGIPTVVYGFFAALTVAPIIQEYGGAAGFDVSSESALAAGLVMGVMIIPFVSSLSDDVISAVPQTLRDGSYALGATKSETIKQVILPAALPGIVGSLLLAVSRAIGETMIVVMAAGLTANLTANPLSNVTTVTVQIVTILVGDQEFDSAKTLSAFALGLVLFCITLVLNIISLRVVKKYREKYD